MNLLRLLAVSFILFVSFGCAEKKPVMLEEFHAESLEDFIKKMKSYDILESSLSLDYKTKDSFLNGDASLKIHKNETFLRVYYLGFPAGDFYEKDGEVSSNLRVEKDKIKQLTVGIRKGFMWWDGDFEVTENEDNFILKDKDREIVLNKNGFMPVKQSFVIENEPVLITYDKYTKIRTDDNFSLTMPSNITVYYKNRTLKIRIDSIKLRHG